MTQPLAQLRTCLTAALSPDVVGEYGDLGFLVDCFLDVPCHVQLLSRRDRPWVIVTSLVPWLLPSTVEVLRELNNVHVRAWGARALRLDDGRLLVSAELPLAGLEAADLLGAIVQVSQVHVHLSIRAQLLSPNPKQDS